MRVGSTLALHGVAVVDDGAAVCVSVSATPGLGATGPSSVQTYGMRTMSKSHARSDQLESTARQGGGRGRVWGFRVLGFYQQVLVSTASQGGRVQHRQGKSQEDGGWDVM